LSRPGSPTLSKPPQNTLSGTGINTRPPIRPASPVNAKPGDGSSWSSIANNAKNLPLSVATNTGSSSGGVANEQTFGSRNVGSGSAKGHNSGSRGGYFGRGGKQSGGRGRSSSPRGGSRRL